MPLPAPVPPRYPTLALAWGIAFTTLGLLLGGCAATSDRRPSTAGVEPPAAFHDATAQAREVLEPLAEQAVGISVAIAHEGRVVWSEAYGYSNLEQRTPATPATRFRLYSISKPLTAAATAQLMEEGRLDAEAAVQHYVPGFPEKDAPITPMQLATHTSGIRHYADEAEAQSQRHCGSVSEALEIFADDPLVHAPGEGQTYSSWGYVLLSAVLERAFEQPYEQAMDVLVFEPAGLRSFRIDDPEQDVPDRANFYRETRPGTFSPAEAVDNTCKWGAGAWLGTAEEVAQFGLRLVDETFLSPRTQQLFLRGQPTYSAQGVGLGGTALLVVDDAQDLSIALLSNASGATLGPALQEALGRLHALFSRGH